MAADDNTGFPDIDPQPTSYAAEKAVDINCPECGGSGGSLSCPGDVELLFCRNCRMGKRVLARQANYGPEWDRIRKWVKARDGGMCRVCEAEEDLHVHHVRALVWFETTSRANRPDNLITLCSECHSRWEGRGSEVYDHIVER